MEHLKALIIKFAMITLVLFIVLGVWGVSFSNILLTSLILTAGAYVLGDLWIFPSLGNGVATVADLGLAFVGIWVIGEMLYPAVDLLLAALISAVIIAGGEWFFHKYMARNVLGRNTRHVKKEAQRV